MFLLSCRFICKYKYSRLFLYKPNCYRVRWQGGSKGINPDIEAKNLIVDWSKDVSLVLQYNATNRKFYFYVNGNKEGETDQDGREYKLKHVLIGTTFSTNLKKAFVLNDIKIWNTNLTDKEIKEYFVK